MRFIYREDCQGYWHNDCVLESAEDVDIEQLEKYSKECQSENPRFSTNVEKFIDYCNSKGLKYNLIYIYQKSQIDWHDLPVVHGTSGNY